MNISAINFNNCNFKSNKKEHIENASVSTIKNDAGSSNSLPIENLNFSPYMPDYFLPDPSIHNKETAMTDLGLNSEIIDVDIFDASPSSISSTTTVSGGHSILENQIDEVDDFDEIMPCSDSSIINDNIQSENTELIPVNTSIQPQNDDLIIINEDNNDNPSVSGSDVDNQSPNSEKKSIGAGFVKFFINKFFT